VTLAVEISQGYEPTWHVFFDNYEEGGITAGYLAGQIEDLRTMEQHNMPPCITFDHELDMDGIGTHQFAYMKPYVPIAQPQIVDWLPFQKPGCELGSEFSQESYEVVKEYYAEIVYTSWDLRGHTEAGVSNRLYGVRSIAPVFDHNYNNIGGRFIGQSRGIEYTNAIEHSPVWEHLPDDVTIIYNTPGPARHRLEISYDELRQAHHSGVDQCSSIELNDGITAFVTTEYHQVLERILGLPHPPPDNARWWDVKAIDLYDDELCQGNLIKTYDWNIDDDGLATIFDAFNGERQWWLEPGTNGAQGVRGIKLEWVYSHYKPNEEEEADDDDNDDDESGGRAPSRHTETTQYQSPGSDYQFHKDYVFNIGNMQATELLPELLNNGQIAEGASYVVTRMDIEDDKMGSENGGS